MEFDLWCVYQTLFRFVEVRGWKEVSEQLSEDEFHDKYRLMNYITIVGVDIDDEPTTIVLTNFGSNIPNHKANFLSMINAVKTKVILVSNRLLSAGIHEYAQAANYQVESYTYAKFVTDMTKCPYVPKHEIMTKSEVDEMLWYRYKTVSDLPGIMRDDTQVIWIGAKVGDVIRITRTSELTGQSIYYRLVKADTVVVK